MPRYFFHRAGGQIVYDDEGTELANVDEARTQAVLLMGELLRLSTGMFWEEEHLKVDVTNECGLSLFSITTFSTDSATSLKARNIRA